MYKQIGRLAEAIDAWGEKAGDATRTKVLAAKAAKIAWAVVRAVIMLGLAFIVLYPLLYMVSMAFRPSDQIFDPTVIWVPRSFTMDNVVATMDIMKYFPSLWQTVKVSIVSSLIQIVSCALTGYGFARFTFKGRGFLFIFVLLNIILPPQSVIIPQYLLNSSFDFFGLATLTGMPAKNILNTVFPFYLPALFGHGIRSGLLIYIYRQFFKGMPKELEDAACIDGAGPLGTFARVMAPNAGAAFLTVFLFSTVWYWSDYYYSSTFMSTAQTLSVRLAFLPSNLFISEIGGGWVNDPYKYITYIQAGCLLCILPILAVYVIFQRRFIESIEKTGIVG